MKAQNTGSQASARLLSMREVTEMVIIWFPTWHSGRIYMKNNSDQAINFDFDQHHSH